MRIVPDFCYWRGLLVLAGDQADNASGQPQSGFWFGSIDDLWSWGKPAGWGDAPVTVEIEVDALGDGVFRAWRAVDVPAHGYVPHVFPDGFSVHWLRLRARQAGTLTAELVYG